MQILQILALARISRISEDLAEINCSVEPCLSKGWGWGIRYMLLLFFLDIYCFSYISQGLATSFLHPGLILRTDDARPRRLNRYKV